MNKISIIIDSVLGAAVIALFVLFFFVKPAEKQSKPKVPSTVAEVKEGNLPIAYLNVDSLLLHYTFALQAHEKLMSKQEDARVELNTKLRTFQNEMTDFQKKYENNAFLSQERAESEYQRLQKKQMDLEQLEQKLTSEIMIENQNLSMQLADSLNAFLALYNANGNFQMIISNQGKDNVLMAADGMDITDDVIAGMNARCAK